MKKNLLVAVLIWAMLAALAIVSAGARTGPSEHVFYPNGCRCCLFDFSKPLYRCVRVCCGDNCC
ncbi:hypothetical protein IHE45_08G064100 [Dioscorea alata]|uniref:Uncharacterized protein n=1 Tax=Dioscorea alata TaxID=55571 RepID=A0ACB7VJM7_DIOAL|nr:hypothetical protein IHE45_08G064100 [Dioscorea alata]